MPLALDPMGEGGAVVPQTPLAISAGQPTAPNAAIPSAPTRDMTGLEAAAIALSTMGDALSGFGGRQTNYLGAALKGPEARYQRQIDERKLQLEQRKLTFDAFKLERQITEQGVTAYQNLIKSASDYAKNNPLATEDEVVGTINSFKQQGAKMGITFPDGQIEAMFRVPGLADQAGMFAPWMTEPKMVAMASHAVAQLYRGGQAKEIQPFIERAVLPYVYYEAQQMVPKAAAFLRSTGKYKAGEMIPWEDVKNAISTLAGDKGPAYAAALSGLVGSQDIYKQALDSTDFRGVKRPDIAAEARKAAETTTATKQAEADVAAEPGNVAATAAREKVLTEARELGQTTEPVVAAKVRATKAVEAAKKEVENKFRGTGPLTFEQIGSLRDDYTARSKDFLSVRDAYSKIEAVAKGEPSPAGDVALIFGFMRINDPASTVREGEFATAQNAAGVPDRIRNLYNRAIEGTRLTPEQRTDFLKQANTMFRTYRDSQLDLERQFKGIATKRGADPDEAVLDYLGKFRKDEPAVPKVTPESLSRASADYKAARKRGLTDEQIEKKFNIRLAD